MRLAFLFLSIAAFFAPFSVFAQVVITEIMYDLEGSDSGREWVEIYNTGTEPVDLKGWKFNDGSNHLLNEPPKNGSTGTLTLLSGEYSILASNAEQFLNEHSVSVSVIDTVMSLGQQDDRTYTITLVRPNGETEDSASYTTSLNAMGDGNSLQKINNNWIAALPTPGTSNSAGEQIEEVSGNSAPIDEPSYESVYVPTPKQTIFVDAGPLKQTALAGADTVFTGVAYGLKGEIIPNARFIWSFGDGGVKEGKSITHAYRYSGEYIVFLTGSSGEYSASDKIIITVIPADIVIAAIGLPDDFFISLKNNTKHEVDLTGWVLRSGGGRFMIPKNTFIGSGKTIQFAPDVIKLLPSNDIALLYPNENTASIYKEKAPLETKLQIAPLVIPKSAPKRVEDIPAIIKVAADNVAEDTNARDAVTEEDVVAAVLIGTPNNFFSTKWLAALLGIIALSLGSIFLIFRQNPSKQSLGKNPADEFEIVEEI